VICISRYRGKGELADYTIRCYQTAPVPGRSQFEVGIAMAMALRSSRSSKQEEKLIELVHGILGSPLAAE